MQLPLTVIASTAEAHKKGFFEALGIDWKLLVIHTIAFLILLWVLSKYVYPPLTAMLEKREAAIEAGVTAAAEAEKKADASKAEIEKLLKQARREANDIVTTAKDEAAAAATIADAKAKERAERIVADAHDQIQKDVVAAQKTLHNETLQLVAAATEKVVGKVVDGKLDNTVIAASIKEAK